MRDSVFITAQLARIAWLDSEKEGLNAALAIAFTIRNRVRAGWFNGDWSEILSNHYRWSSKIEPMSAEIPDTRIYNFTMFLQQIDGIFSGLVEDNITINRESQYRPFIDTLKIPVTLYYGRLDQITNPWFLKNICQNPQEHPRVAQVGMIYFFG